MADRIFGPVLGAGTQVRERQPDRNIVPGQLGSTVFLGVLERGKERDITLVPSNKARLRKIGSILDPADYNAPSFASLETPLAAKHFYEHSDGAGYLVCCRVTPLTNDVTNDDRTTQSTFPVFNREDTPKVLGVLTAANGGRWGGTRKQYLGKISGVPGTDFVADNTITLTGVAAKTMKRDEWKNGYIDIHGITTAGGSAYKIVSNSSAGVITIAADATLAADWAAAGPPVDLAVTLYRDNLNYRGQEKYMSAEFKDGALDPVAYFGLQIRVDGDVFLNYDNLSMDTNSPYYWKDVINDDPNNDLVVVTDSFAGNRLAATSRPANRYGLSKTLTANVLTIDDPFVYVVTNAGASTWVPAVSTFSFGANVVPQLITVHCTDATGGAEHFLVSTSLGNRTYDVTGNLAAGITAATDKFMIGFKINTGSGALTLHDEFKMYVRTLIPDELIGGKVNPDVTDTNVYTIVDNTATTVTVTTSDDLTDGSSLSGGEQFRLQWPDRATGGYDGYIAGMTTADYEDLLNPITSPLAKLKTMNLGLVKMAIPGIAKPSAALNLQKKLTEITLAYDWMARIEIPDEYLTGIDALGWINNSYGRLDLITAFFPSFNYIRDPLATTGSDAKELLVSMTGMHLGREAKVASNYQGYHKAAAGIDVTFPLIVRSAVLGRPDAPVRLDEELLNPAGLNAYRWGTGGTLIAWGDRTLDNTTAFQFKHKRELVCHYGCILIENFDWSIFQINDPDSDADVLAALHGYFLKEYRKRAIRGDSFVGGRNPAAIIKMDSENNTNATRAAGDQIVDISLRLADVVEKLKISIGAMGLQEVL